MYLPQRLLILLMAALTAACVSVSLEKGEVRRSESYRFKDPAPPFSEFSASQVDRAWKNRKTGSLISVVSECAEAANPSLTRLRDEVLRPLSALEIESESELTFQNRGALRSLARGKVDGVESAVDLLVFKKDGCTYILALVGKPADIAADRPGFDAFIGGFEVP